MSNIVTSTDYANPQRPLPIRAFNLLAGLASSAGELVGFDVKSSLAMDDLLEAARKATGHDDFGDDYYRVPLGVLLDSLEREAKLNPLGRTIMAGRITG